MKRLPCNPKGFWNSWQQSILRFQSDWRVDAKELVLDAYMKCRHGLYNVRVLVDTGAKIPLVFKHGLIPQDKLMKASFPVKFSTVDGQTMEGGKHGLLMELRLPVWMQERHRVARTVPLFAYEANIHGVDMIMGYPFLKVFHLQVDTANDRLVIGPKSLPKPPSRST